MSVFFLDWELWQEMTFVLGCCIVIVFAVGLVKLWWTNRAMRRLELIDEEKRARVSLMSHCGIDNLGPSEIPFGVRAIQSGIEVEGIWISRPDTAEPSKVDPVATLVGHRVQVSKGKGKMIDLGSIGCPNPSPEPEGAPKVQSRPRQDNSSSASECFDPQAHIPTQSRPPKPISEPQIGQAFQKRLQQDRRRSDVSTSTSFRNPFTTPAQAPTLCSIGQVSTVGSGPHGPVSESLTLNYPDEAIVGRTASRATQGRMALPSGFRQDVLGHKLGGTLSGSNRIQLKVDHLSTPNNLKSKPALAKLRRIIASEGRRLLSQSSSS